MTFKTPGSQGVAALTASSARAAFHLLGDQSFRLTLSCSL